jgi:hypothetical protein
LPPCLQAFALLAEGPGQDGVPPAPQGYNPPITFVVIQKKHNTRLLPPRQPDQACFDRKNNVKAGVVVDRWGWGVHRPVMSAPACTSVAAGASSSRSPSQALHGPVGCRCCCAL